MFTWLCARLLLSSMILIRLSYLRCKACCSACCTFSSCLILCASSERSRVHVCCHRVISSLTSSRIRLVSSNCCFWSLIWNFKKWSEMKNLNWINNFRREKSNQRVRQLNFLLVRLIIGNLSLVFASSRLKILFQFHQIALFLVHLLFDFLPIHLQCGHQFLILLCAHFSCRLSGLLLDIFAFLTQFIQLIFKIRFFLEPTLLLFLIARLELLKIRLGLFVTFLDFGQILFELLLVGIEFLTISFVQRFQSLVFCLKFFGFSFFDVKLFL